MIEIKLVEDLDPLKLLMEAVQLQSGNLIQLSSMEFQKEILTAEIFKSKPDHFLNHPVSSILDPMNSGKETEFDLTHFFFPFKQIDDKDNLFKNLNAHLGTLNARTSLINDVLLVCDELFSNAVYNASYVDESNFRGFPKRDGTPVEMKNGNFARVSFGGNEDRLVLTCWDSCGSLDVIRYLTGVLKCYQQGIDNVINMGKIGGAGIGSYFIFDSCLSLYIVVEKGKQTLIAASFPRRISKKEREKKLKNLHFRIL